MWHTLKHIPHAKMRLKKKTAAATKTLKIKWSLISSMLNFKSLCKYEQLVLQFLHLGCAYLFPILEVKRKRNERQFGNACRGNKIFG